jgi:hypothetical protein
MALTYGLAAQEDQNSSHFDNPGYFAINAVRVHFTFTDLEKVKKDFPKLFEKYGEYDTLGGIMFDSFTNPIRINNDTSKEDNLLKKYKFAKPLFPNIRHIPLINEITYVLSFPSTNTQNPRNIDLNKISYYYFQPLNIWNTVQQNAFPDPLTEWSNQSDPQSKNISYQQAQAGASINQNAPLPNLNLGNTFSESEIPIKYLQPYEGDVIYEGRWGNSIRFGSTVLDENPWSKTGFNGEPILIIRNGQATSLTDPWIPTIEEINQDLSSIYLGSYQQLPLNAASTNYSSYPSNEAPTAPDQYEKNQIIITSGRLVLNSSEDHILLSSGKSINLNALNSINIDTDNVIIGSKKLYLGDKNADEPLLLGNQTADLIDTLITSLISFLEVCEELTGTDPGLPLSPLNAIAVKINTSLQQLQIKIPSIKSNDNFTT